MENEKYYVRRTSDKELYHYVRRTYDTELYHYGVKGMKWGVRKDRRKGSGKNSAINAKNNHDSDRDHSKSDKSPLVEFILSTAASAALYPISPAASFLGLCSSGAILTLNGYSYIRSKTLEKEREGCEIDPKTGFRLKKDKNMPLHKDVSRVNPEFYNFDNNTKNNCMLCTSAYDLRRRGYEVRAKKASYGYMTEDLLHWYPKAKIKTVTGTKELISELVSQGEGARGNLCVAWKNMYSGHSVAYEVSGGKVQIVDSQSGTIYNPKAFLSNCKPTYEYARLDNVAFDKTKIKEVAE